MSEKRCRLLVLERSKGLCERCGRGTYLTMHHRVKRSHGGPWSLTNIVAVCGDGTTGCHGWIESHPKLAREGGWALRSWENPEEIPIQSWRGTVRLTDMPVVPRPEGGTTVTSFTPDWDSYAGQVDTQDHWFPTNPE